MTRAVPIYLDYHATTPLDPRAALAMSQAQVSAFANPNSQHAAGRVAQQAIETARGRVADLVGSDPQDVRFTTGSTEALRLALAFAEAAHPTRPLRIASSLIEHPALLSALTELERAGRAELVWIDVSDEGCIALDDVRTAVGLGPDLLCLMAVNNEVGTIQPIEAVAEIANTAGVSLLIDATQAAGRMPLRAADWGIDYLVVSAHKIYGPKGAGALVGPGLAARAAPSNTPSHDPTPNVAAIVGFGEAARLRCLEGAADEARTARLRDRLEAKLTQEISGVVVNGARDHRIAGNLHVSIPEAPNDAVTARLYDTVAISTGAACVSGVDQPSHVLQAMKLPQWRQDGALRISLGKFTTQEELDIAAETIIAAVRDVRTLLQTDR